LRQVIQVAAMLMPGQDLQSGFHYYNEFGEQDYLVPQLTSHKVMPVEVAIGSRIFSSLY
jgi:hypothetical protein